MDGTTHVGTRSSYENGELTEATAGTDPFKLFGHWLDEAEASGQPEHNAMALATVGSASISCRIVLLRSFNQDGFVFYTNYNSRKAMDLERDARAALTFFWPGLQRQVRIEGKEGSIACIATAQHLGRNTQVWDAVVTDEANGRKIALFRCTQMILWPKA